MIAFHGQQRIKDEYLARVAAHRAADEIVQGYGYWIDGRGCAVGCTIHGESHAAYESELGIPQTLARLEDRMFEGMTVEAAREWPGRFLDAIPVGADLSGVWPRFAVWLMTDPEYGALRHARTDAARSAIERVAALYRRVIEGYEVTREEWRAAYDAAAYAYAYAAYAAAAAYADAYAAYAAAYAAAAAYAVRRNHFRAQSEELLRLLAAAPVEVGA